MTSVRLPTIGDERRGPVGLLVARDAPDLLAGLLVEHDHERVAFVIEHEDELVAGEHGRHAFAEGHPHAHLHAEVLLPDQRALEVVAVHPARSEERVDVLAVGDRRVRGETAVLVVAAFVRRGRLRRALPEDLAGLAIEREHVERVLDLRTAAAARPAGRPAPPGRGAGGGGRRGCGRAGLDGRREEDVVAPDDRAGVAEARDVGLPLHVLGGAPGERRVAHGHAVGGRPAPVRPVARPEAVPAGRLDPISTAAITATRRASCRHMGHPDLRVTGP